MLAVLLAGTCLLAGLNVWVCFARSAIPFGFDTTVTDLGWHRAKIEGRLGAGSAPLVTTAGGRVYEFDREIYSPLRIGDRIEKRAWDGILYHNGQPIRLRLSDDAVGMIILMPGTVGAALTLALHHMRADRGP